MLLSDKIRIIRKARGLSQEGLGFSLSRVSKDGVSRQAVSDWETGKSEPCLDNIRDLAEVLGVSFDALLDETIDLDDPQVLSFVLGGKQVSKKEKQGIGLSIYYQIKTNAVALKRFKMTIIYSVGVLLTLLMLAIYLIASQPTIVFVLMLLFGAISFTVFPLALIREIIPAIKGSMTHYAGHLNYAELSIEDDYVQMEGYVRMLNTISIPIEKILEMRLCGKQRHRRGNVEVVIKEKDHPLTIIDVMYPQSLIDVYNKIKIVLDDKGRQAAK